MVSLLSVFISQSEFDCVLEESLRCLPAAPFFSGALIKLKVNYLRQNPETLVVFFKSIFHSLADML